MVSMPRAHDGYGYLVALGKLEKPERNFAWYRPDSGALFVEPQESKTAPFHLHEYDAGGREGSPTGTTRNVPIRWPRGAKAFFGLVTPMTEVATLVRLSQSLRWEGRLESVHAHGQPVLLDYLENIRYFVPGTSRFEGCSRRTDPRLCRPDPALGGGQCGSAVSCWPAAMPFSQARGIGWDALGLGLRLGRLGLITGCCCRNGRARVSCSRMP